MMKEPIRLLLACLLLTTACGSDSPGDGSDAGIASDGGITTDAGIDEESRIARYIRSTTSTKLIVEIDSVPGFEPRAGAQADLLVQLDQLVDKPGGVSAMADGALVSRGEDHAWTDMELFELADETFDLAVESDTIKMHVLFVDGHSARDTENGVVLGLAWANTHLVMFKKTIEDICGGPLTPPLIRDSLCEAAEFSIWVHEIGHVLGLVNVGIPMVSNHQDTEHGGHDVSDECVMYWAYEGDALINTMRDRIISGNNTPLAFDDECLADIAAIRDAP